MNKQINEEFSDSEEETIKTVSEEKAFTECDFTHIGEITMRKHVNTKHGSVHSDIGRILDRKQCLLLNYYVFNIPGVAGAVPYTPL